jgi:hypothetical protein
MLVKKSLQYMQMVFIFGLVACSRRIEHDGCLFGLAFLPQDIFIVNCEDVSQETKSDFLITRKANDFSKKRKEKQMTWHTQPRKRHNELKKMPVYVHQKKNELMDMPIYVHC